MFFFCMSVTTDYVQKKTFADIYDENKNAFFSAAMSILHNEQDAEDAVQEAFVHIYKNMKKICSVPDSAQRSLLMAIVRNTSIDIYRRNSKEREHTQPMDENMPGVPAEFFESFEYSRLCSAINRLFPLYKDIIYLYYIHQLSAAKIASLLNISRHTVYKRIERAKILLKKELEEGGDENE